MIALAETATAVTLAEMERFVAKQRGQWATPWHSTATPERVAALAAERARHLVTRENTETIHRCNNFELTGLACWTPLDWDSAQFGFPAARIDLLEAKGDRQAATAIKASLVGEVLRNGARRGIRHLIVRVATADLTSIEVLQRQGFDLIDGIQTFGLRLSSGTSFPKPANSPTLRLFGENDLPQVLRLARSAYVHDRFHADTALDNETADRINETWVRNSCLGNMADAVIVATSNDTVLAYVTCVIDQEATRVLGLGCGEIGMVATVENARNSGVASAATVSALEWFAARGVSLVEVGTQLRNIAAARLYERCGFRLVATSLTFRKLI